MSKEVGAMIVGSPNEQSKGMVIIRGDLHEDLIFLPQYKEFIVCNNFTKEIPKEIMKVIVSVGKNSRVKVHFTNLSKIDLIEKILNETRNSER